MPWDMNERTALTVSNKTTIMIKCATVALDFAWLAPWWLVLSCDRIDSSTAPRPCPRLSKLTGSLWPCLNWVDLVMEGEWMDSINQHSSTYLVVVQGLMKGRISWTRVGRLYLVEPLAKIQRYSIDKAFSNIVVFPNQGHVKSGSGDSFGVV